MNSKFVPTNEMGVVVLFAQTEHVSGYSIETIHANFPDAIIRYGDKTFRVEFEYESKNFILHDHDARECDLIVCWINNLPETRFPVLELSKPEWWKESIFVASPLEKELFYWKFKALRTNILVSKVRHLEKYIEIIEKKLLTDEISDINLPTVELAEKIRPMWEAGDSKSAIARSLGMPTGGSSWSKLVQAVEYLDNSFPQLVPLTQEAVLEEIKEHVS